MPKRILVVDDEPDILDLVVEELEFENYEVMSANSGNSGLEILKKHEFDAVVSDYKMSDGNGKILLDYINNNLDKKPIFYFISGQADMSREEAMQEGVSHFFYKPFDIEDLISFLEKDL